MASLDPSALQARTRLIVLFGLLCALDAALIFLAQDVWAIGRILLTIAVMYFVLQGRKWAKWLLMGLCSLLVVVLIAMVLALGSRLSTLLITGSLALAVLNTVTVVYMAVSKDLSRYFAHKRHVYPKTASN